MKRITTGIKEADGLTPHPNPFLFHYWVTANSSAFPLLRCSYPIAKLGNAPVSLRAIKVLIEPYKLRKTARWHTKSVNSISKIALAETVEKTFRQFSRMTTLLKVKKKGFCSLDCCCRPFEAELPYRWKVIILAFPPKCHLQSSDIAITRDDYMEGNCDVYPIISSCSVLKLESATAPLRRVFFLDSSIKSKPTTASCLSVLK